MIDSMLAVDRALLLSEKAHHGGRCPSCLQVVDDVGHSSACPHDQALGERGYTDAASRERARMRLLIAREETIPPPPNE